MTDEERLIRETGQEKTATEQGLDEAAHVRYLKPDEFILFRTDGGGLRLTLLDDRSFLRVKAKRCFPFSFATKYISLRDGNDEEIGMLPDLAELSKQYRRWIEDDLEMRYFTPRVKSIRAIRRRSGGIEWLLDTDCGSKKVITKSVQDTMTEVEPGRYVITDVDGNRYEIHPDALDEPSRDRLERLI
jgi:hypothetical protein